MTTSSMKANYIRDLLLAHNIIKEESIRPIFPKVRDRDDVSVLKCFDSDVIFLSSSDHIDMTHYAEKVEYNRAFNVKRTVEDNNRRHKDLQSFIYNKNWLDIGTGAGGILDLMSPLANETWSVEPQNKARQELNQIGYKCLPSISDCPDSYFDVISMFHVVEHLTSPIETLKEIHSKLNSKGRIILEIPHARDFLISFMDLESFKNFTFWSEHLVLHTRKSITKFLLEAGFNNIVVQGIQRYPLANHLHWLRNNAPGGHINWNFLRTSALDDEYEKVLVKLDMTDTLLIFASV